MNKERVNRTISNVNKCGAKYLSLGRVGITAYANEVLASEEINAALDRHSIGDWGNVSEIDWQANDNAIKYGERIISSYTSIYNDEFWIITEADRSCTTIMLPSEY